MENKYKHLSQCEEGQRLIEEFDDEWLEYFEREIIDYVKSDEDEYGDYYPDIVMWYRDLIDTDRFIEDFKAVNEL